MPLTSDALAVLTLLLTAHALGEFLLQRPRRRNSKSARGLHVLRHAFVPAALAYALLGLREAWWPPVCIFVAHLLTGVWVERREPESASAFLVRQLFHGVLLVGLAVWLTQSLGPWNGRSGWMDTGWVLGGKEYYQTLAFLAGLLTTVEGGAQLIARLVRPYRDELDQALSASGSRTLKPVRGFANAGRAIGRLERAIIFLFVIIGQPAAVGFLIAAKSIFRFGEFKDTANRMESEYIIIGTLASFGYAAATTYATARLIEALS